MVMFCFVPKILSNVYIRHYRCYCGYIKSSCTCLEYLASDVSRLPLAICNACFPQCGHKVFLSPLKKKKISASIEVKGIVMPRKLHSWESQRCYHFSSTHNVALVSQVGPLLKGSPHTCGVTFSQWRGPLSMATDPHQFHMCLIRPPAVLIGEAPFKMCSHAVFCSQEHFLNINIFQSIHS